MNSPSAINETECNRDALFEILMRVSHRDIFSCSLVSKDWLSVIISPIFRSHYTWEKSNPIVVDSLRYQWYTLRHFPTTSSLGRNINVRDVMPTDTSNNIGSFISKSPKGDLLLFGRVDPSIRLHVIKPDSGSFPVQLSGSELPYENGSYANIIPSLDGDDDEYRVIMACNHNRNSIYLRVYCSRTGEWDMLTTIYYDGTILKPNEVEGKVEGGVVSGGGDVIYWKALKAGYYHCLAVWDVNVGNFKFITDPPPFEKDDKRGNKQIDFDVTYAINESQLQAAVTNSCEVIGSLNGVGSKSGNSIMNNVGLCCLM